MSLLSSIFGASALESSQATVFETAVSVPEPKALPPRSTRTTAKATTIEDTATKNNNNEVVKKRKRKELPEAEQDATVPSQRDTTEPNDPEDNADDADTRTVFVGNLPVTITRRALAKLFQKCGKVQSTRIRSVATTGVKLPPERAGDQNLVKKVSYMTKQIDNEAKSNVSGYVVFTSTDSVEKALELNNTEVEPGRRMRVDHVKVTIDASRTVFVGNLPYSTDESTLQAHFAKGCQLQLTDIEGVRIIRDKDTFKCKGFAYVLFKDKSMVTTALQKIAGSHYLNRELRVQVCGRRFKGKQGDYSDVSLKKKKKNPLSAADTVGALRRILTKPDEQGKKKRARGEKKSNKPSANKSGVSKRAVVESKSSKRVKKIQKRISKGMGKTKK